MTVLVTGATGQVGRALVGELQDRAMHVRAYVRDAARAGTLLGEDVELAVGDFGDRAAVRGALEGAERVFLACGNVPRQVENEVTVIEAARKAGVTRLVKLSAAGASADSPLLFPRRHAEIERHLQASGVPATVLQPSSYMTNVLASAESIRHTGKLFAPAGDARIAFVDPRDVAAVAAVALMQDGHERPSHVLTGPEAITYGRIAEELSRATGTRVDYVDVPDEAACQGMLEAGIPTEVAHFLIALFGAFRDGLAAQTTEAVANVTGRAPRTFARFAADHTRLFAPAHVST